MVGALGNGKKRIAHASLELFTQLSTAAAAASTENPSGAAAAATFGKTAISGFPGEDAGGFDAGPRAG